MTKLTIAASDWGQLGLNPSEGEILFSPTSALLNTTTGVVETAKSWSVTVPAAGVVTTELPDAVVGRGIRIRFEQVGLSTVTVAGYPTGEISLVELLTGFVVDPSTLEPSEDAQTAWGLVLAQVAAAQSAVVEQVGLATDAAVDADAAKEIALAEASAAGTSAFNAGTSAATALGHRNDAQAAAGTATTKAAAAAASAASVNKGTPGGTAGLDGAGDVVTSAGKKVLTEEKATTSYVTRESVYLRDYVSPSKTDAENRTAFVAAITAASGGSKRLCYDGAFFSYSGPTVVDSTDDMLHWASSWDTHKVTQKTIGYGALIIAGARTVTDRLNVDGNNPTLDFTGVTIGGQQVFRYSVGITADPTAHNSVIRDTKATGFMYAIAPRSLTAAQMAVGAPITTRLTGVTVDGVQCDGCWTALQYIAVQGLQIRRIRGWFQDVTGSGGEGHLIYGAGFNAEPSYDVTASDFICTGGEQHGLTDTAAAFKFTNTIGLTISDMVAYDTPGFLSVEGCPGAIVGEGIKAIRDATRGTPPSIQFLNSPNITVSEITFSHIGEIVAGQVLARIIRCPGSTFAPLRITCNPPTAGGSGGLTISGSNPGTLISRPSITNLGANLAEGIRFDGSAGESIDAIVDDPEVVGLFSTGVRVTIKGVDLRYRKSRLAGTRRIGVDSTPTPYKIINLDVPPPAVTRLIGWHRGEDMNSAGPVTTWPSGQQKAFFFGNNWVGDYAGRITESSSGGRRIMTAAFGSADTDISADVLLGTATRAGLCLRASGDSTYLFVSRATGAVKIHKMVAGTQTELATTAVTLPNAAFGNLRALVVGSLITVFLNGLQVISYTLAGGDETAFVAINHGLYGDTAATAAWENVVVRSIS
jgi:hypothetical protein